MTFYIIFYSRYKINRIPLTVKTLSALILTCSLIEHQPLCLLKTMFDISSFFERLHNGWFNQKETFKDTTLGIFLCVKYLDKCCSHLLDALILLQCGWLSVIELVSFSSVAALYLPPPLLLPSHLHAAQPNRLTPCIFHTHPVHVLGVLSVCMPCVCTNLMTKE